MAHKLGCKKSKEDSRDFLFDDFYKKIVSTFSEDSVISSSSSGASGADAARDALFDEVIKSRLGFFKEKFQKARVSAAAALSADLRSGMPPIYDQGSLGSCTANGIGCIFEYQQKAQGLKDFMPSRLFIYYCEREMEGTIDEDAGAAIRDGMIVVNTKGVCKENICPYDISKFTEKPSPRSYKNALKHKALLYLKVKPKVSEVKKTIDLGYPIVFGFEVPNSFMNNKTATTGFMNPQPNEAIVGGHAVVCCGYDDKLTHDGVTGFVLVRNSWGTGWGIQGYFWMPYSFFESGACWDCWTIEQVQAPAPKA